MWNVCGYVPKQIHRPAGILQRPNVVGSNGVVELINRAQKPRNGIDSCRNERESAGNGKEARRNGLSLIIFDFNLFI